MSAVVLYAVLASSTIACTGAGRSSAPSPVVVDGTPLAPAVEPSPARCPHDLPVRLPREAVPGVRFDMVPATPHVLVICVSGTQTVVVPPQLTRIVHALNHLDRVPPGTAYACPADLGPLFALFFDYPDGSRLLGLVSGVRRRR